MDISTVSPEKCTGCLSCMAVCPKNAIGFGQDAEGFLCPEIDRRLCVDCGACYRNCPAVQPVELAHPNEHYAAVFNMEQAQNSASGGLFYALASYVIQELHGYVCGAVMSEDLQLRHVLSGNMEDVQNMQGSKYLQSTVKDCYAQISEKLAEGHYVLFTGTPCQVAGVKQLNKNAERLITVDLICHGTPSAAGFRKYFAKHYGLEGLKGISFRDKNQYEPSTFSLKLIYDHGTKRIFPWNEPFYQAFLDGYCSRESCYSCDYAKGERVGDITIGDCANALAYGQFGKEHVLSSVFVNSDKGQLLWEGISDSLIWVKGDMEREIALNKQLNQPVCRGEMRNSFYPDITGLSFRKLKEKYGKNLPLRSRVKHWLVWHIPVNTRRKIRAAIRRFR